jgi:4-hydroxy-tetrahydrodipicolinate reductase
VIAVAVHGAEGRMGRLVTELVAGSDDCQLAGLVSEPGRNLAAGVAHPSLPVVGQDRMAAELPAGSVVIDFSLAAALEGLLAAAGELDSPLVIGTTGFDAGQRDRLAVYARDHAVVLAANFSIGIPALQMLLQLLARTLPGGFDAEQVETHHVTKRDRPSGTARALAAAWRKVRGGEAPPTHSQRLGGVIGEHTWTLSDAEETLVLTHRAHSRQAFLRGVLPSVRFVAAAPPGLYGLTDVLRAAGGE